MASGIITLCSELPTQIGHLKPDCRRPVWQYFSFSLFSLRVFVLHLCEWLRVCMPGFSSPTTPPFVQVAWPILGISLRVSPHPLPGGLRVLLVSLVGGGTRTKECALPGLRRHLQGYVGAWGARLPAVPDHLVSTSLACPLLFCHDIYYNHAQI